MPIYEYRCKSCDNRFEYLVMGSEESISCPKCSAQEVERLISTFSFKSDTKFSSSMGSGCSTCSSKNCSSCN